MERGGREWKGREEEGGRLVSQIGIFKNLFFYKAGYFGYVWLKQGAG